MKSVAVTICGKRYEMQLEDSFADFVNKDLEEVGVLFNQDNKPDKLLKAYLRLAKYANSYENEIEMLIKTLDEA